MNPTSCSRSARFARRFALALAAPAFLTTGVLAQSGTATTAPAKALPAVKPQTAPDAAKPKQAKDDPKRVAAVKLINAGIEAMGGEGLTGAKSMYTKMSMTLTRSNQAIAFEGWQIIDSKQVKVEMTPPNFPMTVSFVRSGDFAWQENPMQAPALMPLDQAKQVLELPFMHLMLTRIDKNYAMLEVLEDGKLGETATKRLQMSGSTETVAGVKDDTVIMHFDASTNLPVGMTMNGPTGNESVRFKDWKEVGDAKLFHTIDLTGGPNGDAVAAFEEVRFNDVAEDFLVIPDTIQAQIDKQLEIKKNDAEKSGDAAAETASEGATGTGG